MRPLLPYAFPVAPDGHRGPNLCDLPGCRSDATVRDPATNGVYCCELHADRHSPPMTPAYATIAAESVRVGWPTNYRRDLTLHDRRELATRGADVGPFLWILRDYGTHLVFPGPHAGGVTCATLARSVLTTWAADRTRCYSYDRGRLLEITPERAIDLARQWDREITSAARKVA